MCKWNISLYNNKGLLFISIGCKYKTINQWDEWFNSTNEYQTKRSDPEFDKIYKAYIHARKMLLNYKIH